MTSNSGDGCFSWIIAIGGLLLLSLIFKWMEPLFELLRLLAQGLGYVVFGIVIIVALVILFSKWFGD